MATTRDLRTEREKRLEHVLADLRHAYLQLINGWVKNHHAFARGLLAPQIRELEAILVDEARRAGRQFTNGPELTTDELAQRDAT